MFRLAQTLTKQTKAGRFVVKRFLSHTEIRIPVPHGHLAAKVWGSLESAAKNPSRRILALHGWQDNANSFDPLILHPELGLHRHISPNGSTNDGICIVAVDFSGHGQSSHLAPGSMYTHHVYTMDIAAAVDHLDWNCFNMICHSMGGGIAFHYAFIHPDRVKKISVADCTFIYWYPEEWYVHFLTGAYQLYEKFLEEYKSGRSRPLREYTPDEYVAAVKAFAAKFYPESPEGSASDESTRLLFERGSKPTSNGKFVLTRDPNIRCFLPEMGGSSRLPKYLERLKGKLHLQMFHPERGVHTFMDTYRLLEEYAPRYLASFELIRLKGKATHHVHMNEPEKLLPQITRFLITDN